MYVRPVGEIQLPRATNRPVPADNPGADSQTAAASFSSTSRFVASRYSCTHRSITAAVFNLGQLTDHLTDRIESDVHSLVGVSLLVAATAMPETMYRNGIPSGSRVTRRLPGVGPVITQHAARLPCEGATTHRVPTARVDVRRLLDGSVLGFLDHQPLRTRPRALATHGQRRRDLVAAADAARRQDRPWRNGFHDLRPQHNRADLTAMTAAFATLGDDDVHVGIGMLERLRGEPHSAATLRPESWIRLIMSAGGVPRAFAISVTFGCRRASST